MKYVKFASVTMLLLLSINILTAEPTSLEILSPTNGIKLTTNKVIVTGVAMGTHEQWIQQSKEDYEAGTMDNVTVNAKAKMMLDGGMYDDFNAGWDDSKWIKNNESCGIKTAVTNGIYNASGIGNFSGADVSRCITISTMRFKNRISADLISYPWLNSYRGGAFIGLFKDSNNYLLIGVANYRYFKGYSQKSEQYFPNSGNEFIEGALGENWTTPSSGVHNFMLEWNSTNVSVYVDDVLKMDNFPNYFGSPKVILQTETNEGSIIAAAWDNVTGDKIFFGNFTSSIHDTKAAKPELESIHWNATTPESTSLSISVRSSDNPFMQSPTPWIPVNNGQIFNLPAIKRYLQYRVSFNSTSGILTPLFHDIAINYIRRVTKVEISIDGNNTWMLANGTETWQTNLTLPENTTLVWVRASCGAGDYVYSNITVDVDTTLPIGSILINNDHGFTLTPNVTLTLNASDRYGIVSMMISEDPHFIGAQWIDYALSHNYSFSAKGGKKTIYAKFKDDSGLASLTVNDSIILDLGPPVGTIVINNGANYTNSTSVNLTLDAVDSEHVIKMIVSNNADLSGADWIDYRQSMLWFLLPGNGERSVYAKFRDSTGQESIINKDSIFLDTSPPSGRVLLNNGAPFTQSPNITVKLDIVDNTIITSMMLCESATFAGSRWEPYQNIIAWNLSASDGRKTIYCAVQDIACNINMMKFGSIILDTSSPISSISALPPSVNTSYIIVGWSGNDVTSGIKSFDVQYRDFVSAWTDWLIGTNLTNETFSGQDGHNYYFRVRAMDLVGNLEAYPNNGSGPVHISVPVLLPVISIQRPLQNGTVNGTVVIEGTVIHPQPWKSINTVFVKVDDEAWQIANGTIRWSYQWNTSREKNGVHIIYAKAFDGLVYSPEINIRVIVLNINQKPYIESINYFLLIIIIGIVVGTTCLVWSLRKWLQPKGANPR